jgi:hypothetical protein
MKNVGTKKFDKEDDNEIKACYARFSEAIKIVKEFS